MKPASNGAIVIGMTKAHYVPLDGLRGLAILLVVFYHLFLPHRSFHGADPGILLQAAQTGWMGVDLFFVLSGFLITGILLETRTQPHYLRNFLGRRFLRIWPLYYLNLLGLLVLIPMVMPSPPAELLGMGDKQGWFWLYAANWLFAAEGGFGKTSGGYFWSLAVEEQFYLVWPLVVYALSERSLLRTSLALLALSLVSRIVLVHLGVSTGTLYTMTFTHLDGLAVGSCLAVCARSPQLSARLVRMLPSAAAAAVLGLIAIRLADQDFFFWSRQMATYGYTCIAVLSGALLILVLRSDTSSWLSRLFTNRFMAACGKFSYALYLVHVPVAGLLFPLVMRALKRFEPTLGYNGMFIVFMATAFALSWGLSVASWHLFEKRILALKRYFDYDRPQPSAPLAAAPAKTT
jgi:peptidoglycan/LPS O-acetylase OafA/YrhL